MAKQLLPEQCDFLHQQFPPPDCCICNFKEVLPVIVLAAAYLDIGYYRNSMTWKRCVEIWERSYKPALEQPHFGDCIKEPQACFRCQAEDCIEIARIIEEGMKGDEH